MPPQNNQNQQDSGVNSNNFSMESLQKNKKLVETIKLFVIYGTIMSVACSLIGIVISSLHWSPSYGGFGAGALVMAVIMGAIISAIGGFVFYFIYEPVKGWVKTNAFLSKHINSLFTLFWKPYLVVTVVQAALGLLSMLGASSMAMSYGASFGGMFIGWVVYFVANVALYYWYAKTITAKLASHYSW